MVSTRVVGGQSALHGCRDTQEGSLLPWSFWRIQRGASVPHRALDQGFGHFCVAPLVRSLVFSSLGRLHRPCPLLSDYAAAGSDSVPISD